MPENAATGGGVESAQKMRCSWRSPGFGDSSTHASSSVEFDVRSFGLVSLLSHPANSGAAASLDDGMPVGLGRMLRQVIAQNSTDRSLREHAASPSRRVGTIVSFPRLRAGTSAQMILLSRR